jgi:uncharacterized membrane protein YqaE (UPF0057 family)
MIQRIQSLWLLLSALCAALIMFVPVFTGAAADGLVKVFSIRENLILLLIVVLSIVIPFINIFLFKKRGLQKKLIIINMVLSVLTVATEYFSVDKFKQAFGITQGTWEISAILPFFIILFLVFAFRGIRKDEKMLSEADRLR